MEGLADALAQFLDGRKLEPIVLLGGSMGGVVAQHFVLRYPGRVLRLLLVATGAYTADPEGALEKADALAAASWGEDAVTPIINGFFWQTPPRLELARCAKLRPWPPRPPRSRLLARMPGRAHWNGSAKLRREPSSSRDGMIGYALPSTAQRCEIGSLVPGSRYSRAQGTLRISRNPRPFIGSHCRSSSPADSARKSSGRSSWWSLATATSICLPFTNISIDYRQKRNHPNPKANLHKILLSPFSMIRAPYLANKLPY